MRKRRKRALLDVDGFLADFLTPALEVVDQVAIARGIPCKKFVPSDFRTWNIFDAIPSELEEPCFDIYKQPGFCSTFEPYPGSVEFVWELREHMDVYALTSPMLGPTWVHDRTLWLIKHFDISPKQQIHTSAKYCVAGDLLADDKPEHVEEWSMAHPFGMPVLWDQPYNQRQLSIQRPWLRAKAYHEILWHVQNGM